MIYLILLCLLNIINIEGNCCSSKKNFDLTIVGSLNFSKSLARFPIGIINLLYNELNINYLITIEKNLKDIPNHIINIVEKDDNTPGKVALFTDVLWLTKPPFDKIHKKVPSDSKIKISYSMIESTLIPNKWVSILNSKFDAVVVPDQFLVEIYKNSGVKIPIFVLPMGVYLEDFFKKPEKKIKNNPFVFGCSAVFWERKNLYLLMKAFLKTFRNNTNVKLKIHTNNTFGLEKLKKSILQNKIKNIELITENLSWHDYVNLFTTFDCYVLVSKGEGFSITPREALALGIPCILSNNTAHINLCKTGFVYPVKSLIKEPAYNCLFQAYCGYQFNCNCYDVSKALQEVYNNYDFYLEKAKKGRIWVSKYLYSNLKNKYLNLIKPRKVILGKNNEITNQYLMTNSEKLYRKYLEIGLSDL